MALFAELRRRNVLKVALIYAVASWLVLWFVQHAGDALGLPGWAKTLIVLVLATGFPVALVFAWIYDITSSGVRKTPAVDQTQSVVYKTGQKLNAALAVLAVLGLLALIGEDFMPEFQFPVFGVPEGDAPSLPGTPAEIRSLVLDNGMKVIVWPDHDIPNVALYNFVRASVRNEQAGATGLSHFFEHMMFLGTRNHPAGEFDRIMEAAGGSNNAYTSKDLTVYQDWFPRSALETVFQLEADRLQFLAIDEEVLESERNVVLSERQSSVDDDNFSLLMEQVYATAFVAHPYQFPVIGWPADIAAWTERDLNAYFRSYYAPGNCLLVVAGDVTPQDVFRLATRHLAPIPAQRPASPVRAVEPAQQGGRRVAIERDAAAPLLHMAFHAGAAGERSTLVLDLLLKILATGDSSRLHRSLVEESGVAIAVGGYQDEGFDAGLAYFYLTLAPDADPLAVEERVMGELQRAATEGVSEAELDKARSILLADFWRGLATIDGKASALGYFEVLEGGYESLFDLPARVGAIGIDELRDVAAGVFRRDNLTTGTLRAPDGAGTAQ